MENAVQNARRTVCVVFLLAGVLLKGLGRGAASAQKKAEASDAPTFSHDIAPILYKNCLVCHHAGAAGPFPLLTYLDAQKRARQIMLVTQSRLMPPCPGETEGGDLRDARRLSPAEQEMIRLWAKWNTPEGDPASAPMPPAFTNEWPLGKPDLIVRMPKPYLVPADGPDVFRNFVLPLPNKATQ